MSDQPRVPRRGGAERAVAWLVTGPLGHLYGTVADLVVLLARSLVERVRAQRRLDGAGRRSSARR